MRPTRHVTPEDALAIVENAPPVEQLVVCDRDPCAPNTIIDAGAWSGHVELGSLGLADRWADLAIAAWSMEWNYGPGWERALLNAYEIEPDPGNEPLTTDHAGTARSDQPVLNAGLLSSLLRVSGTGTGHPDKL
jgi:aminoglycoside phosphotransferase